MGHANISITMDSYAKAVAAAMCDKSAQKMSLWEKLEAFKTQTAGTDRADAEKAKRKEETL